ncbi:MAG: hypothetical protein OEM15_05940 [Myxococcales bacterium]|nr:hypothetical protein [Myxococcales bacterium]MDH3483715.1 hypothetical protein [Myxococcales bacterium]
MGEFPKVSGPPTGVGLMFDVSMWPLVVITMPPVMVEDDITYMRECYEHVFSAPTRHALIVDTTKIARVPEATMRRQLKEFEDSNRPIIRKKNIGSAIIIQNAIVRGAYTALRWISPQPAPNKAFSTMEAAASWCVEGIEGDGQIVPIAAYAIAKLAKSQASG